MAELIWTSPAIEDYLYYCGYLKRTAESFAKRFASEVVAFAEDIAQRPLFGAEVIESQREGVRERLYFKYRIIYLYRNDVVEVLCVMHGA